MTNTILLPATSPSFIDQTAAPTLSLDEALILNRVTDSAWQVCDGRHLPHSPGYLLGFVEQIGETVELMQIGNKFIWTGFSTMRAALNHVVETAEATVTEQAQGELHWIR